MPPTTEEQLASLQTQHNELADKHADLLKASNERFTKLEATIKNLAPAKAEPVKPVATPTATVKSGGKTYKFTMPKFSMMVNDVHTTFVAEEVTDGSKESQAIIDEGVKKGVGWLKLVVA